MPAVRTLAARVLSNLRGDLTPARIADYAGLRGPRRLKTASDYLRDWSARGHTRRIRRGVYRARRGRHSVRGLLRVRLVGIVRAIGDATALDIAIAMNVSKELAWQRLRSADRSGDLTRKARGVYAVSE